MSLVVYMIQIYCPPQANEAAYKAEKEVYMIQIYCPPLNYKKKIYFFYNLFSSSRFLSIFSNLCFPKPYVNRSRILRLSPCPHDDSVRLSFVP